MPTSIDEQITVSATSPQLLDETVEEVFSMMLGATVSACNAAVEPTNAPVTLTSVIGLAGNLSGAFTLVMDEAAAKRVASTMLGIEVTEVEGDACDAVGEITNILAGTWKSKIPAFHAGCLLSVPTVVKGTQYDIHRRSTNFHIARSFMFDGSLLTGQIFGEQS